MRHLSSFLIAAAFLITACNNNKKTADEKTTTENKETTTSTDANAGQNNLTDLQKATEELQKLPPLSLDELKALIPQELMGGKRSSYNATSAMGAGVANAEYTINDSTNIKLMVYDCGGPGGAGIYSMQYLGMFNMESENEHEYTKTIDFNGGKAIEKCQKDRNDCSLTYFTGKRFLVALESNNVGIDGIKQAANSLNIK
jgi:hypothetical protein